MKTILLTMLLALFSTCSLSSQKSIFFNIDTLESGTFVLAPLINNRSYTDSGKPVYTKSNFRDFILQVYQVLVNTIPNNTWGKISEKEKLRFNVSVTFGLDGTILEVFIFTSEDTFHAVPEVGWNEVCKKVKHINVLPYISITDYDKETFTYSRLSVFPFRYAKKYPERLK